MIENFVYDDRGSLSIFETDMAGRMTNGAYEYDILGRLTHKTEAGSEVIFDYVDGSYRPVSVSVNGQEIDRALAFDQAGNLWLNGVSNVAYKLNGAGLPEKALRYGEALPAGISLEQVDAGNVATAENVVAYEYDGLTRIYERRDVNGEFASGRVTVPGFGSYTRGPETGFSMERLDLPGGGYRTGADGAALFPLTDAQGSIRGYANLSGVRSAHAYYPYGSVEDLSNDAPEDARRWQSKEFDGALGNYYFGDARRWQSKEFDGALGNYYFGARYYDPLLGLWMSPDPAGQFSNPYGYGGDPVNYVDPTGMWALGLGLVVGWDEEHGWQFGVGAALDLSKSTSGNGFHANLMYTWNQDDSEGFNVSASGQYYCFTAGLSYSYNSYTGQTLSGNVGVCFGVKGIVCAGAEAGGTLYWDHWGDFMGATAYAEFQASAFGGLASAAFGGETGAGSVEGRGLFAGATVAGVHAEVSERDGRSLGFQEQLYYKLKNLGKKQKYVGLSIPSLGIFADRFMYDHANRNDNPIQKEVMGEDGRGVNRKKFEEIANKEGMITGEYSWIASQLHPDNTVKMWMGRKSWFSFLYGWLIFPSVEGLFFPGGDYASAPSYNYGNNLITHFFLDMVPYLFMDKWFPNP